MNHETDTPRTDALDFGWGVHSDEIWDLSRQLERGLLAARDDNFNLSNALSKAEAEVKELKEDARRVGTNRYQQLCDAETEKARLKEQLRELLSIAWDLNDITVHTQMDAFGECPSVWDESTGKWINRERGLSEVLERFYKFMQQ